MQRHGKTDRPLTRKERTLAVAASVAGCVALLALAVATCGCEEFDSAVERYSDATAQAGTETTPITPATKEPVLDYRFGGFKGGSATEVAGCRIGSLRVSGSGLSYKWEAGGCEALGAADKGDYSQTVACAFYKDGDRWVGGKFDWISTSRTSRSFENIKSGYNGWDAAAFFAAKHHAFCIVSKDGRKRSNLATTED